jgi:hypothetical protein
MRISCVSAAILSVLLISTTPAEAQLCTGSPSYANQPYQAALTAAFTEGAHGIGGEFGVGGEALFATAGVGVVNFRDLDALSTQITLSVGADLATSQRGTVFVCPLASIGFGVGPDVGRADVSTIALGAGGSIGVIASQTNMLMVVPTFGLAAIYDRVTLDFGGDDVTNSDTSGRANVGVGFIFNRNIGITPGIEIPFSAGNSDPVFVIRLSFAFGG